MKVPFLNLNAQYEAIKGEIHPALQQVLDTSAFAGGPMVSRFEESFAAYCQARYAIGVGSGTDALWMALLALGIGPGDEVITVPNTFIATAEAISFCGATPVFVDVDERTCNLDPNRMEDFLKRKVKGKRQKDKGSRIKDKGKAPTLEPRSSVLAPRTTLLAPRPSGAGRLKAIVPVHLYGQMADMDPIMEVARKYGLWVIEDACQAHGAEYKGKRAGSLGAAGCFSFYPGKNLGAYGEAGAVVTNDKDMADKMKMFRDHGQSRKYYHGLIGWNARMDGFQGAVLSVKLKYLEEWNESRRKNAALYRKTLAGVEGLVLPEEAAYGRHVYHLYPIRVKNRDRLLEALAEKEIYCGIHYPVPLHLQEAYGGLGYKRGDFPVAETIASELLSLPMFPELTEEQIEFVSRSLKGLLE
jgi:dTDP-4-amino-4,6-dideoxygalactose transaminase